MAGAVKDFGDAEELLVGEDKTKQHQPTNHLIQSKEASYVLP